MDRGCSSLNPSTILDLKAELHKKYDAFRKAKIDKNTETSKRTPFKSKFDPIKEKKEKPVVKPKEPENPEEELSLQKSRLALEAKAKFYDKIVSNNILIDDEQNDAYLVDFQRKVLYSEPNRTDNINASTAENQIKTSLNQTDIKEETSSFLSSPIKASEKPSKIDPDQPIHYQNIHYNEVRDHGTAYFAFSMDEDTRKEQMKELNSMRQETEEQRLHKQHVQRKRKAALQARLAKICDRKNIDQSVLGAFAENTEAEKELSPSESEDLSSIPLPEEKQVEPEKKEPKIRPWDIGKDTLQSFVPEKRKKITQTEYISERREERESQFAPPSFYS